MSANILLSNDIIVTLEDFLSCGLSNILMQLQDKTSTSYHTLLLKYRKETIDDQNKTKILWLLESVSSMNLSARHTHNHSTPNLLK